MPLYTELICLAIIILAILASLAVQTVLHHALPFHRLTRGRTFTYNAYHNAGRGDAARLPGRSMSPSVVLSLLLGSLYGLLWHACLGRRWGQLPVYWLISILGFFAGYALAVISGIQVLRLGTIPLLE